jgi:hypothetical protein
MPLRRERTKHAVMMMPLSCEMLHPHQLFVPLSRERTNLMNMLMPLWREGHHLYLLVVLSCSICQ